MSNIRHKRKNKRWWISENESRYAYSYAQMYNEWKAQYSAIAGLTQKDPDTEEAQSVAERNGIMRSELSEKLQIIERTLIETDPFLYPWISIAVTNRNITYDMLLGKGIPCSDKTFYDRRRKFYYLLIKKI